MNLSGNGKFYSKDNPFSSFGLGFNPPDSIPTTLLNNLIWYYKLDETTGSRLDSSVSGLDLAVNGTVGNDTGTRRIVVGTTHFRNHYA